MPLGTTRRWTVLAAACALLLTLFHASATFGQTIWVLRHGETVGEGRERALSQLGQRRAAAVAEHVVPTDSILLLSSDYVRTRQTLAPLAQLTGSTVELYDPRNLEALAERVTTSKAEVIVIAGHSNTVRETVESLGGAGGEPIDHDEHDRLYRLERDPATGAVTTTLLRSNP